MFNKLLNLIFDEDENLKFSIGFVVVVICILLLSIVQGM